MNSALFHSGQYTEFVLSILTAAGIDGINSRDAVNAFIGETSSDCLVHSQGGHEGDGEYVERVFLFKDGDVELGYLRFTGFYTSEEGTSFDSEITRVYPRTVQVTKYFATPA